MPVRFAAVLVTLVLCAPPWPAAAQLWQNFGPGALPGAAKAILETIGAPSGW